ncbi:MAG: hypothetical protein JO339_25230 [Alphaproteobacteria bacterium]|nr:hypothetical protein [Alphaproteobacteria bacterium]
MSLLEILLSLGLFAVIVGVAYWLSVKEQKMARPGPVDLDQHAQDAGRQAAGSITNVNIP